MLGTQVQLLDIRDVEGFVCKTIERSGLRSSLTASEREDLVLEGICILYALAKRFEPTRVGYATAGSFAGYAARYLPRRLGDAWHSAHPEHRRLTGEDGKRHWRYDPAPLSLDAILESEDGGERVGAIESEIRPYEEWAPIPAR